LMIESFNLFSTWNKGMKRQQTLLDDGRKFNRQQFSQ